MNAPHLSTPAALALFTLAEVKAATDRFESGAVNLFDTLDAIVTAVDDFRAAAADRGRREAA